MSKGGGTRVLKGAGVSLGAVFGIPASAQAVDITVTNLNDTGPGSLRAAIAAANAPAGGHIVFQSGLTGTITLGSEISLGMGSPGAINIDGPGPAVITVSGNNTSRIFNSYGSPPMSSTNLLTISGLTLTGGNSATNGGAILNHFAMNLTVNNMTIIDNTAGSGGGIASFGAGTNGTTTITNSTITGNHATDTSASPNNGGGGLLEYGSITSIQNTTISGNTSARNGGGVHARVIGPGSTYFPTINGSTISGNTAAYRGGGLYGYKSAATITNTTISGNSAVNGSGMAMKAGRSTIRDTTISGNTGASYGGGVWADGAGLAGTSLKFYDSTIANNSAGNGGGISAGNHVTDPSLQNTIVADNTAAFGPDVRDAGGDNFNADFSLIENASGATVIVPTTGSSLLGIDPQLQGLTNNGGPTQTQRPALTSPVLDQGKSPFGLDQRGLTRAFDIPTIADSAASGANAADIGAVELTLAEATPPPVVTPTPAPIPTASTGATGQRAAALAKCKKKKGAARKKCKKKAKKLPV
jgi:hypothetical protein